MAAKIKICGITNSADARLAAQLGADLLGFNFYEPSPRFVTPNTATRIISLLPTKIVPVGLFVNASVEEIEKVLVKCPLQMVQLHGEETNEQCQQVAALGVEVIKAVRVRQPEDITNLKKYNVSMILLDAFREELYGGTGHSFDWSWINTPDDKKIFLAGGITPDNIEEALSLGTYGIDLCSGVEIEPGVKDAMKLKKLFEEITGFYGKQ